MTAHLGPGSTLPGWMERLEVEVFGDAWGPLDDHEQLWMEAPQGYARWALVVGEAELLRIAVAPGARGQGLGRRLLRESTLALAGLGVTLCHLEVRVSNTAARRLYESEGWAYQGLRKGYYRNGEDAALYRAELGSWIAMP